MQDKIEEILKGNFDYDISSLDFSCIKLELEPSIDTITEGTFSIYGPEGSFTSGYIYSSDFRMKLDTDYFAGESAEIHYSFDSHGMTEGDVLKGEFSVISSHGEFYLPFVVSIMHKVPDSSMGSIKNLFHFTNLAKSNWDEALKLFSSPDFSSAFLGNDRQFYQLYNGLSCKPGNSRNMEEFLLAVNKKQRIEYLVEDEEIKIDEPIAGTEYGFTVTRNGWGYSFLEVSSSNGLFIFDKSVYTEDNFIVNKCNVWFKVDTKALHKGNNFDEIILKDGQNVFTIPATVSTEGAGSAHGRKLREIKHLEVDLMTYYQAFRLKKISMNTWLKETENIVNNMINADESNVNARLFQAQVLISMERENEARWILDQASSMLDETKRDYRVSYAYHLYLTSLITKNIDFSREVTETVSRIYSETKDWRIAWLVTYLSEEYNRSDSKRWMFLEEQFKMGCTSPIVYIEALRLMLSNPMILRSLENFELQVCYYGARNECLSKDLVMQIAELSSRQKEFSPVLFKTLTLSYEKKNDNDILNAICSYLIRNNKVEPRYFKWYALGAEAGLRLTRLYEYYMMSMDTSKKTPINKTVLMYFAYNSDLDYIQNAHLYADVLSRRDKFPDLYNQYLPQMENFAWEQLKKKRINKDLAQLYKALLSERMMDEETIHALSTVLFMNQIKTDSDSMIRVIIRHPRIKGEMAYPIVDRVARFPLWGQEHVILFEDIQGNRYAEGVNYTVEKLMIPGKIIKMIGDQGLDELGLNMYICDFDRETIHVDKDNRIRFERVLKDERVMDNFKAKIHVALTRYYYDNDITDSLDWFLSDAEPDNIDASDRDELMRYMIIRGMTDKAYEWLCIYGTAGIEVKNIVKLLETRIEQCQGDRDEELVTLCMYAFRKGKFNEAILNYLIKNYEGMTKDLRSLWKAALSYDIDTYYIAQKIIVQILYTGAYVGEKIEIFKDYVSGGAKTEIETAFVSQCAYEFFVNDRIMDGFIFDEIQRIIGRGEKLHRVCKLAIIKYYAEHMDEVGEEQKKLIKEYVTEFLLEGIRLACFTQFKEFLPLAAKMDDSAIIEYHATLGAKAVIHYILEKSDEDDNEYREEDMDAVYGGVFFKEIPLFFGESIQYYITEIQNGKSQLTESATLQKNDIEKSPEGTRYNLVNDIAIAQTLQDYDTVDGLLREYKKTEYLSKNLFKVR
jgi:hypothetical protein